MSGDLTLMGSEEARERVFTAGAGIGGAEPRALVVLAMRTSSLLRPGTRIFLSRSARPRGENEVQLRTGAARQAGVRRRWVCPTSRRSKRGCECPSHALYLEAAHCHATANLWRRVAAFRPEQLRCHESVTQLEPDDLGTVCTASA